MRTDLPPISLSDVLSEIPDSRHQRGKLYPLAAVLTMVATAMLCGARSLGGHRRMGAQIQPPRSVPGPRPQDQGWDTLPHSLHQRTLHRPGYPFGRGVWAALTRWILAQGVTDLDQRLVAIDGKTLRGSQGH